MKWLSCILFLLALGLSAPAYAGGHACCAKKAARAAASRECATSQTCQDAKAVSHCSQDRQDHPEQHGECPAGCNCSCCHSAVFSAFLPLQFSVDPPRNTYLERRMDDYLLELPNVFWHPPRLI